MYEKDSFIVVSDFHSFSYPIDIIKNNYLNKYDKIYILGDATDRGIDNKGTNGINVLLSIMYLSYKYKNRVIYIPGNHDLLLYKYTLDNRNFFNRLNLIINGGENTCRDIDNLKINDIKLYNKLIKWLENLPIQRYHIKDYKKYALAHALFNERLYRYKNNFSLKDYINSNNKIKSMVMNTLWFRKYGDEYNTYNKDELPNSDTIMIVGHTPYQYRYGLLLDLVNSNNEYIKVMCVDGGIPIEYNNQELLYYSEGLENTYIRGNKKKRIKKELIKKAIAIILTFSILGLKTCSCNNKKVDNTYNKSITSSDSIKKKIKKIN